MARNATDAPIARQRPSLTLLRGSRGVPETVTMRTTTALAPCLEGIALADEVLAGCNRVALALANGSDRLALAEIGRLGRRAGCARNELRRLAGVVDPRRAA